MKVLVTGGAGFIGSHLVDRLLAAGKHVVVLDKWAGKATQGHVGNPAFQLVKGDIRDYGLVQRWCEQCDVVFHLAGILGTSETLERYDLREVFGTNIRGTINVLQACRASSVRRVVFPATPDVFWLNPYKITKHACERLFLMFYREYGLECAILRLGNVYGPRERWHAYPEQAPYTYQKIVPTFIVQALRNLPLPIFGSGTQSSMYIHVSDAVRALVAAAQSSGCVGKVVPIGTTRPVEVLSMASQIIELTGSKSTLQRLPMRPGEYPDTHVRLDTSIAERLLGYRSSIDLRTGLEMTIPYYAEMLEVAR